MDVRRRCAVLVLGLVLWLVAGCTKQKECTAAIDQINSSAGRLEKVANAIDDSAKLDQVANMSEKLAKAANEEADKLAKVTITVAELKVDYDAYLKMVRDAATAADNLAKATRRAHRLLGKLEASETSIDAALAKLKALCAKGPPECASIGEVLNKAPSESDEKKLVAAMRQWIAQMEKLHPKDAELGQALVDVKKVITTQANFLERANQVQQQADAAAKQLDAAVMPEDKLIDAMNKTCGVGK